jgi:hypothetical protein
MWTYIPWHVCIRMYTYIRHTHIHSICIYDVGIWCVYSHKCMVCMSVCIYIYIYIYTHTHTHDGTHDGKNSQIHTHARKYTFSCVSVYIHRYTCLYACVCMRILTCMPM